MRIYLSLTTLSPKELPGLSGDCICLLRSTDRLRMRRTSSDWCCPTACSGLWARKSRAKRKSVRTFRARSHSQTISIAFRYRRIQLHPYRLESYLRCLGVQLETKLVFQGFRRGLLKIFPFFSV